jgi:hypothetical protein
MKQKFSLPLLDAKFSVSLAHEMLIKGIFNFPAPSAFHPFLPSKQLTMDAECLFVKFFYDKRGSSEQHTKKSSQTEALYLCPRNEL